MGAVTDMSYDAMNEIAEQDAYREDKPIAQADDDVGGKKSSMRIWIIALVAIAALIGIWFLIHSKKPEETAADAAAQVPVVTVVSPGRETVSGRITASGTLAARREMPVGVAGEGGQISQVLVDAGQWVRAGQVMAIIDRSVQAEQAAGQAAQIHVAEADARLAQANLDRALRLVDRGFISKADVDRLTATRDAAAAQVRVARARLGETRAQVRRLNVVAPADGLVLERLAEPGQVVSGGSGTLFKLAKGGEVEMLAQLTESDLANLATGTTAEVTPVGTAKSFTGQVWQVSPVINPQTRQGQARIALSYAPELRPGGFATATIQGGTVVAPILPEPALLSDNNGSYVYIVGKDNKIERRNIKTGAITDNGIVVTEGLTGTERVVQRAGAFLSPGETVKPKAVPKG